MHKLLSGAALAAALTLTCLSGQAQAYSEIQPVGTLKYDPAKAYSGYTLVDVTLGKERYTKLVDMNGNEVHRWENTSGMPSKMLPGGQILTAVGAWPGGQQDKIAVQQLDWDGKVLWEFRRLQAVQPFGDAPVEDGKAWVARQHHDLQREGLPTYFAPGAAPKDQGNTLILGHINSNNPRIHEKYRLLDDIIYEVDWNGNIVWQYAIAEHADDWGFDETAYKAMRSYPPADNPRAMRTAAHAETTEGAGFDWFHVNSMSYVGPNKWYDAGDTRFAPDNILINSREGNVFGIIDRKTKKVVWRVGPDYGPNTDNSAIGQCIGAHGVHMIPRGLPGEGNILVFDNGGLGGYGEPNIMSPTGYLNARRDHSRVLEIDPTTKTIVWEYRYALTSKRPADHYNFHFYSPFTSIAQRLPNGNTVISEGDTARVFEVTPELETVWEYIVPEASVANSPLYRSYRVPYEWVPQLAKPREVPVVPPAPLGFVLPDAEGTYPQVMGTNSEVTRSIAPAAAPAPAAVVDEDEEEQPAGMHSY